MRLIDADALVKQMTYAMPFDSFDKAEWARFASLGTLTNLVDTQPTIDAVPVVHGEWIGYSENDTAPKCSNCRKTRLGSSLEFCRKYVPYCEWCGAKMDGKEQE